MIQDRFPIGFWNYQSIEHQGPEAVTDWSDAGMTLTMGPNYGPDPRDQDRMRAILDHAGEKGIRVILCHSQTDWRNLTRKGEATYRKEFQAAVEALGSHPAVFGFHVGDEPGVAEFEDACRAIRIQKELAPRLRPFCNLLPWYDGVATRVGYENWGKYLDDYVAKSGVDFLCYDCYAQMNPGVEGWDMYFANLRQFEAAARRHAIPFWTTLLSVGHFRYRCPSEDDLRWQVNTALAHGAKGLLWFFFYLRAPHDNYRLSPIDEHGQRTGTYQSLSRICRTFLKWTAPVLQSLSLQRVSHVGKAWGGVSLLDGSGRVRKATSHHKTDLIVSEFADGAGRPYVMVVNNSPTEPAMAEVWFAGRQPQIHHIEWEALEAKVTGGDGWTCQQGADFAVIRPWLAPGQAELYRIEDLPDDMR